MPSNNFGKSRQRSGSGPSGSDDSGFMEERPAGLPWKLLVFSLIFLLFSVFVFLGLKYGYGSFLENQQQEVDDDLEALAARLAPADQEDFLTFYSQMTNLQDLLNSRPKAQNTLAFLENNTLPLVYFNSADYTAEGRMLSLSGTASSLRTLIEQLSILENNSNIESVSVGQISVAEGETNFNLEIVLSQDYLLQLFN